MPSCVWGDVAEPLGLGEAGQHRAGLGLGMLLWQSTGLSWEQPLAPRRGAVGARDWQSLVPPVGREASQPLLPAQSQL